MRLFLFSLIHLITSMVLSQQSAVVTYKAELNTAPEIYKPIKEKFGESVMLVSQRKDAKINEIVKDLEFKLQFNPKESRYEWETEMPDETMNQMLFMMAKLTGGGLAVQYSNVPENLYMQQFKEPSSGQWVRETTQLNDTKWKITKETDSILGYPVIKAVQGRKTAWFAPAIPVPFGPAEAHGLPGLVLKYVYANKRIMQASKIKWYKKQLKIKRSQKGLLRTEEEGRAKRMKEIAPLIGN